MRNSRKLGAARGILVLALLGGLVTQCANHANAALKADQRNCPVTIPNGVQLPSKYRGTSSSPEFHGNGKLWTALPVDGRLLLKPDEHGSLNQKFNWWRGIEGRLTITGRRLDGPAGPLRAWIPEGYGEVGFQSSGIYFPSEGCWQITGGIHKTELTFVLDVRVRKDNRSRNRTNVLPSSAIEAGRGK